MPTIKPLSILAGVVDGVVGVCVGVVGVGVVVGVVVFCEGVDWFCEGGAACAFAPVTANVENPGVVAEKYT